MSLNKLCSLVVPCKWLQLYAKASYTGWPIKKNGTAYFPQYVDAITSISVSSGESQKGAITIQRCSVETQKGAIAIDFVHR